MEKGMMIISIPLTHLSIVYRNDWSIEIFGAILTESLLHLLNELKNSIDGKEKVTETRITLPTLFLPYLLILLTLHQIQKE
jgi:hypothetical protein